MSSTTQLIGRLSRVSAATAIAVGISAGLAAAPASAAPASAAPQPRAHLKIVDIGYDQYRVSVTGVFPMSQADARAHLDDAGSTGGVRYVLRGAEPADRGDEARYTSPVHGFAADDNASSALHRTAEGLGYFRSFVVDRSVLDEDSGSVDFDDELYAQVEFIDGDGSRQADSDVLRTLF